jgi:hypothetical protein
LDSIWMRLDAVWIGLDSVWIRLDVFGWKSNNRNRQWPVKNPSPQAIPQLCIFRFF